MIAKLRNVAIAFPLLLTAFAANAAEPAARLKTGNCSVPYYPTAWQDEDLQGTVRLAVLVGADGSVKSAKVVESSGHSALDKASLRAGSACKFEAKSKDSDSDSESVWTTVQYKWVAN